MSDQKQDLSVAACLDPALDKPNSVDACHAIDGSENSPYIAEWLPSDGGAGASYVGEELCLPRDAGAQQLAFAPIADGLGLFAHQGVWHRPGVIQGWIDLPEPYLEIRLPLAGCTRIETASGETILESPRRLLVNIEPSGAPCEHHNVVGEFNSRLAILVTASHLQGLLGHDPLGDQLRFIHAPKAWPTINTALHMTPQLARIAAEVLHNRMPKALTRLFLAAKGEEILSYVLMDFLDRTGRAPKGATMSARDRDLARRARDLLMTDLGHPPLVSELARSVGLTQRRLNALFQELYGGTVLACLMRWRMALAQDLLRSDTLSIKEIAFELGYQHSQNFISAFQKQVGISPSEARTKAAKRISRNR